MTKMSAEGVAHGMDAMIRWVEHWIINEILILEKIDIT